MDDNRAALAFDALGNPSRLAVLRLLVRAGEEGLNVSAIRDALDLPASTLAHHLSALANAGIVVQEKLGRELISRADFAAIRKMTTYLMKDCCSGVFPLRSG